MVGYRRGALRTAVIAVSLLLVAACSGTDSSTVTIRSPEDVQVLTPKQVKEYKRRAAKGLSVGTGTGAYQAGKPHAGSLARSEPGYLAGAVAKFAGS